MKYSIFSLTIFLAFFIASLQPSISQTTYAVSTGFEIGNGKYAPLWLASKRYGLPSIYNNGGFTRASMQRAKCINRNLSYRIGAELVDKYATKNEFFIHQAFADIRYKKIEIHAGSQEEIPMLKNFDLSSGGLSWSGNARPIPQAGLRTADYVSFPWLMHGKLEVKLGFCYGWYTDNAFQREHASTLNSYNQNIIYHRKFIALRHNFRNSPWQLNIAAETHAQFGSDHYMYDIYSKEMIVKKSHPTLKNYLMTLMPLPGDNSSVLEDREYMYGNTLGSEHIRLTYKKRDYEISGYLENYFEDFSGIAKQNGMDGLWGIEYKNNLQRGITGIVIEYLQTTNQSGPIHWAPNDDPLSPLQHEATGSDNYYNNHYFSEGWSHYGMNIGNPLLTSPVYNENQSLWHNNNRVKAIHGALSFQPDKNWTGRIMATWSQNRGTMDTPYRCLDNRFYSLIEINYSPKILKGWRFSAGVAFDKLDSDPKNRSGFEFRIGKKGIISGID